jgi:hypothetical protein
MQLFPLALTLIGAAGLMASASGPAAAGPTVTLVRNGRPAATIVTSVDPTPAARLAALELRHHVMKITGASLPIRTDAEPCEGDRILVGESRETLKLGLKGDDFKPQEYLIRLLPHTIVLIGRDWRDTEANRREVGVDTITQTLQDHRRKILYSSAAGDEAAAGEQEIELPGYFDDQGTCYAAYDFLERFCDVRWYGPTELNTICPHRTTLTVRGADVRRSPALKYRYGTNTWDWPMMKEQWNNASDPEVLLHLRRMRLGGEKWAANHSLYELYYKRFGKQDPAEPQLWEGAHPEFFAKGYPLGPTTQLCYSDPGLIRQVAQDACDYFEGKGLKAAKPAMGDYFAVVPMDDANWCKCERCRALLALDRDNARGAQFSTGTASHYLFHFVNEVAKIVRQKHPDKFIAALAYHVYSYRPGDMQLEPNLSVAPCLHARNYWAPSMRRNDMAIYRSWVDRHDRPIYLWNYYCFPTEVSLGGGWHCFPGFQAHTCAELAQMYARDGVRGVFLCGIGEQVDFYVTMRMYDDPTLNVDAVLREFFTRYFGAAAKPMQRFYRRIEQTYTDPRCYPPQVRTVDAHFHQTEEIAWKWLGTADRMKELGDLMAQAERLATTDEEKKRVALWKRGVWDYMTAGREAYLKRSAAKTK